MLTPDQQDKDLGTLKFGSPYIFTYNLTNASDKPANIVKLSVGCSSCTTVRIDKQTINPGERGVLTATFTPGSTGINLKNISLAYNINGIPMNLVLKFKANVTA